MDGDLNSDDIRQILFCDSEIDEDSGSIHNSDIASNIGEEFENLIQDELGDNYEEYSDHEIEANEVTEDETNEEVGAFEPLQEVEEMDADESQWREWNEGDTKFNKYAWANNSGYKPPQGKQPETPLEFFQLFFMITYYHKL